MTVSPAAPTTFFGNAPPTKEKDMADKALGPGAKCEPDCEFCTKKPAPTVDIPTIELEDDE